jgi:hypothetical protein
VKILISLPSPRELKDILATQFFDQIKKDKHNYLMVTHSFQILKNYEE